MVKSMVVSMIALSLTACAHHGAVRVDCDGPLRPVNTPTEAHDPPVSVAPAKAVDKGTPEVEP
jgi:hypothetical protein